jgi:hypothetical protein
VCGWGGFLNCSEKGKKKSMARGVEVFMKDLFVIFGSLPIASFDCSLAEWVEMREKFWKWEGNDSEKAEIDEKTVATEIERRRGWRDHLQRKGKKKKEFIVIEATKKEQRGDSQKS